MQANGIPSDYQRDWAKYFRCAEGKPARQTCIDGLKAWRERPTSECPVGVDIGCGSGRDAMAMLADHRVGGNGHIAAAWRVIACDNSDDGLERLMQSVPREDLHRLTVMNVKMEEISGDARLCGQADMINASFALPFCEPRAFGGLWNWIDRTLVSGGIFAGQIFGDRHGWAKIRPEGHFRKDQVERLVEGFELLRFEEVDQEGDDACGGRIWHHLFHIVGRKK
jgi:tellurite methyltransferase